jgi:hypothetical protein
MTSPEYMPRLIDVVLGYMIFNIIDADRQGSAFPQRERRGAQSVGRAGGAAF